MSGPHAYLPEKVENPLKMKRSGWARVTDGNTAYQKFFKDVPTDENESVNDAFGRAVAKEGLRLVFVVGNAPATWIENRSE